jgi:hypothetical protein
MNVDKDAFSSGQIGSKIWLCEELEKTTWDVNYVYLYGGWYAMTAFLLLSRGEFKMQKIRSIDIDPKCEEIANTMNKIELMKGNFHAVTADMCNLRSDADVAINTSCEHITQDQYEQWLTCLPQNSLLVLQSNNYKIHEHIRISEGLDDFVEQSQLSKVLYCDKLDLPLYDRYMIIGYK